VLKLPLGITAYWEWSPNSRAELLSTREPLDVPAGHFECARVAFPGGGAWFARGVGLVKLVEDGERGKSLPAVLVLERSGRIDAPLDTDLRPLLGRALAGDPRGAPLHTVQLRSRELRDGLRTRFCRVFWRDESLLLRERGAELVRFDPLDVAQWNALLAEEGQRLACPERRKDGFGLDSSRGMPASSIAMLTGCLVGSSSCEHLSVGVGERGHGLSVSADEVEATGSVVGTTPQGKPWVLSVTASASRGTLRRLQMK
jgi:hypothetical protein